jgi:ribosomal-protein-serine acetyltransferase
MSTVLRVDIRPYTREDAQAVWEAAQESLAELRPWMPWCHEQYSIEESRAWLEVQVPAFRDGNAFEFAIVATDGRYLGGCGLNQVDTINKRANLSYWVRSSVTRRGVATTAIGLLRAWGFRTTDLVRLEVVIAVENLASLRVAQKAGAEFEGTLRKRLWLYGIAHDATMFSFTRTAPRHGKAAVSPAAGFASKVGFARALLTFFTAKTVNFELIFDF